MPALLLSHRTATVLQDLVAEHDGDSALKELKSQLKTPLKPAEEGSFYPDGIVLHHHCLVKVAKWATTTNVKGRQDLNLSSLLKGAQVAVPIKPKAVRSPELIETLRRIQLIQEQEEYDQMLAPNLTRRKGGKGQFGFQTVKEKQNPWQTKASRSEAEDWDEVRRQIGAIINVTLSVIAVAAATWWAGGNADPIWKTLVAMSLSMLVAVAEIALYARHWDNVQKRKEKPKRR